MSVKTFQQHVWDFYKKRGRKKLPWRKTTNPYHIFVSEVMLQQTQVDRVIPKYKTFLQHFPTLKVLAKASQRDVLKIWQGLGYNRRARNLKKTAELLVQDFNSKVPQSYAELIGLPGIGPYTAHAILAFAYNKSVVMLETNIRTVFLHHFFKNKKDVSDKDLLPLIEKALDNKNPREWYWALMDYGTHLKQTIGNLNKQSKHFTKQKPFKNSHREKRGNVLKALTKKNMTLQALAIETGLPQKKLSPVVNELTREGFLTKRHGKVSIA